MKTKSLKKIVSFIVAVSLVFTTFAGVPFDTFAATADGTANFDGGTKTVNTADSAPSQHIYYSDLFYGYSYYLNDNTLFANHIASQDAMNTAFNEYLDSPQFIWSAISKHISLTTSMSELMKAYSDKLGLTNISYNNNLDDANKIFVQALFELKTKDIESLSQDTKFIDQFKKILGTMQKVLKSIYDAKEIKTYDTFVDLLYADMEEYCTNLKPILPSLKSGTYTAINELLGAMDDVEKTLNIFASLIISLGMEDVRLDLIKEIIETQDSESILHEGMSRLYSQLQNGFVGYFFDTYFKNGVINEISKNVSKYITQKAIESIATATGKLSAQTVTSVLGVVSASIGFINTVIFDWILNIPSIEDYQVTMILAQYSDLMRQSIVRKQTVFQSQFKIEEIEKYETLVGAYAASMRCALDECKGLVSKINEDASNKLEARKMLYGDNFYGDYIEKVKKVVEKTAIENRKISNYGTWILTGDTNICGGSDTIETGNLYCIPQGFPGNILKDYDYNTINIEKDQNVQINGNLTINQYTGTGATIQPNASIKIQGDFFYNKYDGLGYSDTDALIENYGTIKVEGNAKFTGDYSYYFGGRKAANFNNYGNMEVNGNFTMMEFAGTLNNDGSIICNGEFGVYSSGTVNNNGKISLGSLILYSYYEQAPYQYSTLNMSSSAVLEVSGDIYIHDYDNTFGGKLILNGDKQQKIHGLKARNIEVRNPMGIKYLSDVTLYGEYRLNGNPLDNNGFKTYCYADASFADNSDYKELYVAYENTVTLKRSIRGNITVVNEGGLIIPSECDITIDGNVHFGARTDFTNNGKCEITGSLTMSGNNSWMPSCDYIRNNGTLSVRKNLLLETNSDGEAKLINGANSTLRIGGNFDDGSSNKLEGSVIFDGTLKQTVTCSAPTIILKNKSPEGVVFTSPICPSRLFNHNGNKYTLYNNSVGSSFVDYDGDGLKDNEDPCPTLPDGTTSITIPDNMTSIDDYAFYGCTELTAIIVDEDNKNYCSVDGVLYNKDKSKLICYPAGKTGEYTIPDSVTSIDDDAFHRCTGLTGITIPDSVTNIGDYAFSGCTRLTSITIPNSVTSIGDYVFYDCTGLTSITIPDRIKSIGVRAFSACTGLTSLTIPDGVASIGNYAFSECTGLTDIIIPNSVTKIVKSAFNGCTGLTSITIPNSVTSIGNSAFSGCTSLTSIIIPGSVTSIDRNAFSDCTSLTSVTIPDSVTNMDWSVFSGCKIKELIVADGSKIVTSRMVVCKSTLEKVMIPDSVTNIGGGAFSRCSALTSITIPGSVTSIGKQAFSNCTRLKVIIVDKNNKNYCSVDGVLHSKDKSELICYPGGKTGEYTIPDGVTNLGCYAFSGCTGLTSITIRDGVTSIGDYVFSYCTGLTSITMPNSITSIGRSAFYDCTSLTSVTIPDSVTSIGNFAFSHCTSLISITIPNSATSIDYDAFSDTAYYNNDDNWADGVLYIDKHLIEAKNNIINGDYIIHQGTKSIAAQAFFRCTGLTNVTIPNSVTSIGNFAFEYCASLTNASIPNSVTSIGELAFSGCTDLTSITMSDSVTSLGERAFTGCKGLTSITIPDSVTSIGCLTFYDCTGLTCITIPNSVTSIGYDAFKNCDNLTIRTTDGSAAHKYAVENNIKFEFIPKTALKFSSAYLTVQSDLSLSYKVSKDLIDNGGYSDPYVVFELGDRTVKTEEYTLSEDGKSYVFTFDNISPDQMNDTISATLHASFNGVEYTSETKEYSVAQYCYNLLGKYTGEENAKLRTLLVDLLNYGSASQLYTNHNTESLANSKLTEEQKGFATDVEPTLTTVKNTAYKTIENPSVAWKGAGLNLQKSVAMRFKFAADSADGLSVLVESASGSRWTIDAKAFDKVDGGYAFLFDKLGAGQMSEPVYLTVYKNGEAVSNTVCYSVESYAYAKRGTADTALGNLLVAMMKYGNSAKAYAY